MADKKDLVEAQSFSRRRLLTAFTAGAPGGKELEPAKPLRAVVAGAGLAAGVVIAGLFYGLLDPGLPDGWENDTLILTEDSGARYLAVDGTLYPVANATSARMLVEADAFRVVTTDTGAIGEIPVGPAIGIQGAPDDVPAASSLVPSGWTACLASDQVVLSVPGDATANGAGDAAVVTVGGRTWVVTRGARSLLPEDPAAVLRALGLSSATAAEVDARWLDLFTEASPLAPLMLDGAGATLPGTELTVGAVVVPEGGDTRYLVTPEGALAPMSDVAYQLYLLGSGASMGGERTVAPGEIAALPNAEEPAGAADWPTDLLVAVDAASACALLEHDPEGAPTTALATAASVPDPTARAIAPRAGALVAAGGAGTQATRELFLVDDSATAYALPGADQETLARLGYTVDDATVAPRAWMQFFAAGPALTVDAARSTPQGAVEAAADSTAEPSPEPTASQGSIAVDGPLAGSVGGAGQRCEPGILWGSPEPPAALSQLQSEGAWERATGAGTVIAVVDSGIDASNPHLVGAVIGGVNLVEDGEDPQGMSDTSGHGTAVAGLIAAREVDGSAVVGLAPGAELLSVRVYRDTDEDTPAEQRPSAARTAEGIRWAVAHGAHVINVSMSADEPSEAFASAIAEAERAGVLVVASAGNRTTAVDKEDTPRYPAAYPEVLAVTAVDADAQPTEASIHGAHVDVAAPGQSVLTATTGGLDCLYAADAASASYATGYASAAAALVAQAHPDESPALWRYRLTASATRGDPDARDDQLGWGVIQPLDAITLVAGGAQRGPAHPELGAPAPVEAATTTVEVTPAEDPLGPSVDLLLVASVAGLGLIGALAVLAAARRSPARTPGEDPRQGLLDRATDAAIRAR